MTESSPTGNCSVCNKKTTKVCGRCKIWYYCNKEHQKQHWKVHKSECDFQVLLREAREKDNERNASFEYDDAPVHRRPIVDFEPWKFDMVLPTRMPEPALSALPGPGRYYL